MDDTLDTCEMLGKVKEERACVRARAACVCQIASVCQLPVLIGANGANRQQCQIVPLLPVATVASGHSLCGDSDGLAR